MLRPVCNSNLRSLKAKGLPRLLAWVTDPLQRCHPYMSIDRSAFISQQNKVYIAKQLQHLIG